MTLTFAIAMLGAVLGAASLVLHALGVKYPTAEKAAKDVDKVKALVPDQK